MKSLQDIRVFLRVVEAGSISQAARDLDQTPAAVSAAVKRLEAELDFQLLVRSTRSLRLTNEGERFVESAHQALDILEASVNEIHSSTQELRGKLRISMPSDLGRNIVLPWIDEFMDAHPQVQIQVFASDTVSDIYSEAIDLTLRYGYLPDSSLVSTVLLPDIRRVLCASPIYIEKYGAPKEPKELVHHQCISFMRYGRVYDEWEFQSQTETLEVKVSCHRVTNDSDVVRRWLLNGYGIAYRSELDLARDLESGALVELCSEWNTTVIPLNMMYADRRQITPLVMTFREFLKERLASIVLS
ncbi:LysR family transcriptional regulator [Litoribrevibacter euphylliae]|uniref:LysR family transcriptional regulator n=1 Tax=Litoribrevibacter euphylliae TaxID=1834034 RepID=A0ABV7HFP4_9GAMM